MLRLMNRHGLSFHTTYGGMGWTFVCCMLDCVSQGEVLFTFVATNSTLQCITCVASASSPSLWCITHLAASSPPTLSVMPCGVPHHATSPMLLLHQLYCASRVCQVAQKAKRQKTQQQQQHGRLQQQVRKGYAHTHTLSRLFV